MQDMLAARLMPSAAASPGSQAASPGSLKLEGGKAESPGDLRKAATEFEALFLGYMLSVMRKSIEESGLTEKGLGQGVYTEMFDQELARNLAGRGALGIADLLVRRLSQEGVIPEPGSGSEAGSNKALPPAMELQQGEAGQIPEFHMPLQAQLSSTFGTRQDPISHQERFHRGIDIAAPRGMGVRAACAGCVTFSGYESGYGNTVVVRHPGGFSTRYAHLENLLVKPGDALQAAQVLGTVGNTGRSTGPHLHFEVCRYGESLDPVAMMSE